MGLRFRKSISLFPGVRLNFSKSGMSVSSGVPGFRKTINTKGQVTTTVGIPGTGLYYVDTKKPGGNQSPAAEVREHNRLSRNSSLWLLMLRRRKHRQIIILSRYMTRRR